MQSMDCSNPWTEQNLHTVSYIGTYTSEWWRIRKLHDNWQYFIVLQSIVSSLAAINSSFVQTRTERKNAAILECEIYHNNIQCTMKIGKLICTNIDEPAVRKTVRQTKKQSVENNKYTLATAAFSWAYKWYIYIWMIIEFQVHYTCTVIKLYLN